MYYGLRMLHIKKKFNASFYKDKIISLLCVPHTGSAETSSFKKQMSYNDCLLGDNILSNEVVNSRAVFNEMKPIVDLKIVQAEPGDKDRILKFLQKNFYPEEPLSLALKRMPKSVEEAKPMSLIGQQLSFIAIDALVKTEDNIVGVVINNEVKVSDDDQYDQLIEQYKNDSFREILKISKRLDDESNLWKRIQVEKVFHTYLLSIKAGYRGLNIGKKLLERSFEKAKSCGYTYATNECSSFYSARLLASLGFELFHEIRYKDHLDENGRVIFEMQKPHEAIAKYVKRL